MDLLLGQPVKHGKLVDVGGNTGLIARLFHATGRAEEVHCLDKVDYSEVLSEERIIGMLATIQCAREQIVGGKPGAEAGFVFRNFQAELNQHPSPLPKGVWKILPTSDISLHKYIWGDYYELEDSYDCITSFSSLDHFSPFSFFQKAQSLLRPGGMLCLWHINWYWVLNSPMVYADFSYGAQRLTPVDLWRYFDEHYPEEKERAQRAYGYWHCGETGYVLNDYLNLAVSAGLTPLGVHRLVPLDGKIPSQINNWKIPGDHGPATLKEVLRDIHCFKSDVTMFDLITQSFFIAFKRV